uniref:Uncharacterized protein n=1 Tax=Caenorhabditis japonica TaxID=281687 RepID=A0A8R1EVV3_CAEJA
MSSGKVIVYGGKGALGSAILEFFKKNNFVSFLNNYEELSEGHSTFLGHGHVVSQRGKESSTVKISIFSRY